MRRERVTPQYSIERFQDLYKEPWKQADADHPHLENCPNPWLYWDLMEAFGKSFKDVRTMADLSCGDARIPKRLAEYHEAALTLGDFAPGYDLQGTIDQTVEQIEYVDLFVCTNTIEHLDNPDRDLMLIRPKCREMLLSCPIEEWPENGAVDEGHYWAWDRAAVEDMLSRAGFQVSAYV